MTDQFATLNGDRIISARITLPYQGTWSADVVLAVPSEIKQSVVLQVGDLSMVGTVIRSGSFSGSRSARIVGGGGGWRKVLKPKAYSNPTGVKLKSILEDAARESGESMYQFTDKVIGTNYIRDENPAEHVLRYWAPNWWIDTNGKTHIEQRPSERILSPFTVEGWSGAKGFFEISTEKISDWVPGKTFTSATVTTEQSISQVSIETNNEGKLRLQVLNGPSLTNRLLDDIRSIVREEMAAFNLMGIWEYRVAKTSESIIDAVPVDFKIPLPQVTNVRPLFGSILTTPSVGDKVSLVFLDGNPTKPRWVAPLNSDKIRLQAGGMAPTEHLMTLEATVVLLHNLIFALGSAGLPPAWLSAIPVLLNAALAASAIPPPPGEAAQILAATSIASAMVSGAGNTTLPYAASLAALSSKVSDESGLFPQLGCPKVQGG